MISTEEAAKLLDKLEKENYSARHLITNIAMDWVELSHDKVKLQRDDFIRWAKEWLKDNP
jgi:hypothetical protein